MKILHLSDIHFGRNNKKYNIEGSFNNKDIILENLLHTVADLEVKPDHIIMTGDIAWHGKKHEFEEAVSWFKRLLEVADLTAADISFCPGNHDVNRGYVNYEYNIDMHTPVEKMDEYYRYDKIHNVESPLENYNWFCHQLGIVPYEYPCDGQYRSSYSVGYRDISERMEMPVRLFSFNTALFSALSTYPDDKNLIGQPQIIELKKYNLMKRDDKTFQVAIFHHAERFLHPDEISEYNSRRASLPLLRENVDLVLCGHTETGGKPVLYQQDQGAYMLTAGAAYYDDCHPNAFTIIDLEKNIRPRVEPYICDGNVWRKPEEKVDNKDTIIIEKEPIIGKLEGQGVFTITSGEDCCTIPISNIKLYEINEDQGKMDNRGDPTRLLDISAIGFLHAPGKAKVSIKEATEKEYSVKAMLEREKVFAFLHETRKKDLRSGFEMKNALGDVFFSGDNIIYEDGEDGDKAGIEILESLRLIEEQFDIRFKCPLDVYESDKEHIDLIVELLQNKYVVLKDEYTITTASMVINEVDKMKALYQQAKKENRFYLICKDSFSCELVGRSFDLEDLTVFAGPYTVDIKDIKYKKRTFVKGDSRTVMFSRTEETKTLFILQDHEGDNPESVRVPCEGAVIQIGNMKLNIGFIKEQGL